MHNPSLYFCFQVVTVVEGTRSVADVCVNNTPQFLNDIAIISVLVKSLEMPV